ncbi:MAG: zinc ABC transporter substrate-binding protein [Deltaproteobacteria bacterium]|nr:zinc ABC transporter substrate-binding protein [Deltaproteobacteria bacterium]
MKTNTYRSIRHRTGASALLISFVLAILGFTEHRAEAKKLNVVATIPTYGAIAKVIAGDRAVVRSLARGYEDPHFVRPKPSLAILLEHADLLVSTGLDLELWLPTLLDKANNPNIRSGQPGFVSVSKGIHLLEKPKIISHSEGGVHIYGNPHIYTGPLNGKIIARNIMIGLKKLDPAGTATYEKNYKRFTRQVDEHLFGKPLLKILGSLTLNKLALSGKLVSFLKSKSFRGKKLITHLGGWMKLGLPLRDLKIIAYHKNWAYFTQIFGMNIIDYVEPKPGIPPSPGHVAEVIGKMKSNHITVLLAGNYYATSKVKRIAQKVSAHAAIVPLSVEGDKKTPTFFTFFDVVLRRLLAAAAAR